ncbi:hypothetical protein DES37_11751 [Mangrovibacter plantisponsor]|uniref:Uncharacterized protein n=1 Tax=Mangrovibacter plantisponsor TaxID=451513 RepID=A0A317PQI3_9ENTR|nr:hypothetical protein DES37_11751 [Mangrovibacter plantisponsor]
MNKYNGDNVNNKFWHLWFFTLLDNCRVKYLCAKVNTL